MTEVILSRACGHEVVAGDVVLAPVSTVCITDGTPLRFLGSGEVRVWDPSKIVIAFDHLDRVRMANLHEEKRSFARLQSIPESNLFDIGRHGLSHQIPAEHGLTLPGTVYVGGDTQAATMGAMNTLAIAANEGTYSVLATGKVWMIVPPSMSIVLKGQLPAGFVAKDVAELLLTALSGKAEGKVLEFSGPAVASLSMDTRLGISNVGNGLGALSMIFPPDEVLFNYLHERARSPFEAAFPDDDVSYPETYEFDLATLKHTVRGPDDSAAAQPVTEVEGLAINAAYLGSCSSSRLEDLGLAASIVQGKHVHPSVRFVVTPISSVVAEEAGRRGYLQTLVAAGATVTTPGCGACFAGNQSPLLLGPDERCITSSVENNRGRMGADSAEIYVTSPGVVAASAIAGHITDPRNYTPEPVSSR